MPSCCWLSQDNPLFPDLPVKYADLQILLTTYQDKMSAAHAGRRQGTLPRSSEARDALIAALRQIAGYIQSLGLTNESDVLSSGFDIIIPGKHPQSPLSQPVVALDNSVTGRLGVDIGAVPNAKAYHVQYAIGNGPMVDLGIFPNTRNIVIPGHNAGHKLLGAGAGRRRLHAIQFLERGGLADVHVN